MSSTLTIQLPDPVPTAAGTYPVTGSLVVTAPQPQPSPTPTPPPPPPPAPTPQPQPNVGQWVNVTPSNINLDPTAFNGDNFGELPVVADPTHPGTLYAAMSYQGIWKSADYGQTWQGPIDTGGLVRKGKTWCLAIGGDGALYTATGNAAQGILKSTDGGVTWQAFKTNNTQAAASNSYFGNDVYSVDVDPNDPLHLIAGFHGVTGCSESVDGGVTWNTIPMPPNAGTSHYLFFIPGTDKVATRLRWLAVAQENNGANGTWLTANGGVTWTQVATFEHYHGNSQAWWTGPNVGYIGASGGVYRTTDGGQTWAKVSTINANAVCATATKLYASFGWADQAAWEPHLQTADRSNDMAWTALAAPTGMTNGAKKYAVVNDGTSFIVVSGNYLAGLWRYVEPSGQPAPAPSPTPTPPPNPTPTPPGPSATLPALTVQGSKLVDATGKTVTLRGVSSQGMAMVYGDRGNPGTYLPMTVQQYVQKAKGMGANAIRLCFEPFPCSDPGRLYATDGKPYCAPDLFDYPAWPGPNASQGYGEVIQANGNCYQATKVTWAADKGQPWNLPNYAAGDVVVGLNTNHVYQCTQPGVHITTDWGSGPTGTDADFMDGHGAHWKYLGEWGTTGTTAPSGAAPIAFDGLVMWRYLFPALTSADKATNFADWKAKVMDPAVQAAVDAGLYVVICLFDFGPATHPLRKARMTSFWAQMMTGQWTNHPNVIFELWNESEDIGSFAGGPNTWAAQKPTIQGLVDSMRSWGAHNVIIVPPPFFSAWVGEATASPLTGSNIAYACHLYASEWVNYQANRDQVTQALASGQCILFTEVGDDTNPATADASWITTTLKPLLDQTPAAGWFAWALTQTWSPDLFSDAALTQLTVYGQAVQAALGSGA